VKKNTLKYQSSINEFRAELKKQNKVYLILNDLPANKVHVQFEGKIHGENVVWNACFQTIEEYAKNTWLLKIPNNLLILK